jgi:hypothetical protein
MNVKPSHIMFELTVHFHRIRLRSLEADPEEEVFERAISQKGCRRGTDSHAKEQQVRGKIRNEDDYHVLVSS